MVTQIRCCSSTCISLTGVPLVGANIRPQASRCVEKSTFCTHGFHIKESKDSRKFCPRILQTPTQLGYERLSTCLGSRRSVIGKVRHSISADKNVSAFFVLADKQFRFCNKGKTQVSRPSFCTFDIVLQFDLKKINFRSSATAPKS